MTNIEQIIKDLYETASTPYFIVTPDKTVIWANGAFIFNYCDLGFAASDMFRVMTSSEPFDLVPNQTIVVANDISSIPSDFHVRPIPNSDNFLVDERISNKLIVTLSDMTYHNEKESNFSKETLDTLTKLVNNYLSHEDLLNELKQLTSSVHKKTVKHQRLSDYSSLLQPNVTSHIETVSIYQYLDEIYREICDQLSFLELNINLVKHAEDCITIIDPQFLTMGIVQLVENVVSHNSTNSLPDISIEYTIVDNANVISVIDNGKEIPQKVMETFFKPFHQYDNITPKDESFHIGLGLSICYEAAKKHGGKIVYERKDDKNIFSFHIPIKTPNLILSMPSLSSSNISIKDIVCQGLFAHTYGNKKK